MFNLIQHSKDYLIQGLKSPFMSSAKKEGGIGNRTRGISEDGKWMVKNTWALLVLCVWVMTSSCDESPIPLYSEPYIAPIPVSDETQYFNRYIQNLMGTYYLWNDEIKASLFTENVAKIYDTQELFYEMLRSNDDEVPEEDTWSYMRTYARHISLKDDSTWEVKGFGGRFFLVQNATEGGMYQVFMGYTIPGSPLWNADIRRGDRLLMLDSVNCITHMFNNTFSSTLTQQQVTFTYLRQFGDTLTVTVEQDFFADVPCLYYQTYDVPEGNVGYIVYQHFDGFEESHEDLDGIFSSFKNDHTHNLILDLRYNDGLSYDEALHFASYLIPEKYTDSISFLRFRYNKELTEKGLHPVHKIIRNANAVNIESLVIITSQRTLSSAEMLIHCLRPYLPELYVIGQTTGGETVKTQEFYYPDIIANPDTTCEWIITPVVARIENSINVLLDYEGIIPDTTCSDDIYHYFGVDHTTFLGEACAEAAFSFLQQH